MVFVIKTDNRSYREKTQGWIEIYCRKYMSSIISKTFTFFVHFFGKRYDSYRTTDVIQMGNEVLNIYYEKRLSTRTL